MRLSILLIILFVVSIFCQQQNYEQNYIHPDRYGTSGRQSSPDKRKGDFPYQRNQYPDRDSRYQQQIYENHKFEAGGPVPIFNKQIVNDAAWEYTWDGEKTQSDVEPFAVTIDDDNNRYVFYNTFSDETLDDIVIIKFDSLGNEIWKFSYDGPVHGLDRGELARIADDGTIIVVGVSRQTDLSLPYILIKLNSSGKLLYYGEIPVAKDNPGFIKITSVVPGKGNSLYFCGYGYQGDYFLVAGGLDTNMQSLNYYLPTLNSLINFDFEQFGPKIILDRQNNPLIYFKPCVIKLDSLLNEKWTHFYTFEANPEFYDFNISAPDVVIDSSNSVYIHYQDNLTQSLKLIKLDANGDEVWRYEKDFAVEEYEEYYSQLLFDQENNLIVVNRDTLLKITIDKQVLWKIPIKLATKISGIDKANRIFLYNNYWNNQSKTIVSSSGEIIYNTENSAILRNFSGKTNLNGHSIFIKINYGNPEISNFSANGEELWTKVPASGKYSSNSVPMASIMGSDQNIYVTIRETYSKLYIASFDTSGHLRWKREVLDKAGVIDNIIQIDGDRLLCVYVRNNTFPKPTYQLIFDFEGNIIRNDSLSINEQFYHEGNLYEGHYWSRFSYHNGVVFYVGSIETYRDENATNGLFLKKYSPDGKLLFNLEKRVTYNAHIDGLYVDENKVSHVSGYYYDGVGDVRFLWNIDKNGNSDLFELPTSRLFFDKMGFIYSLPSSYNSEPILSKYNLSGIKLWEKNISEIAGVTCINFSPSGRIVIAGAIENNYQHSSDHLYIEMDQKGNYTVGDQEIDNYFYPCNCDYFNDKDSFILYAGSTQFGIDVYSGSDGAKWRRFLYTTDNGSYPWGGSTPMETSDASKIIIPFQKGNRFNMICFDLKNPGLTPVDKRKEVALLGSFPNPFNYKTIIKYAIPEAGNVEIKIFNTLGQEVKSYNQFQLKGENSFSFGDDWLSSGLYFYSIKFAGKVKAGKIVLIK